MEEVEEGAKAFSGEVEREHATRERQAEPAAEVSGSVGNRRDADGGFGNWDGCVAAGWALGSR